MRRRVESKLAAPVDMGSYLIAPKFTLRLINDDTTDPDLAMDFEVRDGRVECRAVHLTAQSTGREVQTSDLRAVKVDEYLRMAVDLAATPVTGRGKNEVHVEFHDPTGAAGKQAEERRRRVTDALLREVAAVYLTDEEGRPTQAVAETLGVAHRTAVRYVQTARRKGFIPPLVRGDKETT